jgi:beta-N-acetylhexosaminidase
MQARLAVVAAAAAAALVCGSASAVPTTSLRTLAGGTIVGALEGVPTPAFLARVRAGELGGVILVGRSWTAPEMTTTTTQLQRAACVAGSPLLIGVDQEGGVVRRLPWAAPFDSEASLGAADEPDQVEAEAGEAAASLRAVGVDVDFAPVADVRSRASGWLGSRTFSSSPGVVASLVPRFVAGLQQSGIASTAKHFPGLGDAPANTDDGAVIVRAGAAALRRDLAPFRAAVDAGVQLVMISSASYPALDRSGTPAMFSRPIVTGLLRQQLGFSGVVVTDALDAPAAARTPHAPARAIGAGVDLLLYTSEGASEAGFASLAADVGSSPILRSRLETASSRITALKSWLAARGGPACG